MREEKMGQKDDRAEAKKRQAKLKKEEKKAREVSAVRSDKEETGRVQDVGISQARALGGSAKQGEQGFADEVVKASTEKVSAVFDWIVEQVPSRGTAAMPQPQTLSAALEAKQVQEAKATVTKSDLATKMDLERFYVALCRKLYDEGL